ncbi:hypothetical protein DPMN_179312 [Dreissena polymorpha]|uniref:Uncharacterized protein n=1 Tax=Dreissena polymorpha TaxID=45954 RepID=A0A9D4EC59_DREPO|nr:hypothetical protein DPMN_179312 [Dreissena polymorpha]
MCRHLGAHTAADKTRYFKLTKLPPRFSKQRKELGSDKGGVIGSFNPVLAGDSMPTMASMSQPVQSATTNGMQVQEAKFYKGDQQDSVIDVSNHPNSDGSSTRSSPHMENQAGENQWEGNIRGLLGG